jgi:hypothetical protein
VLHPAYIAFTRPKTIRTRPAAPAGKNATVSAKPAKARFPKNRAAENAFMELPDVQFRTSCDVEFQFLDRRDEPASQFLHTVMIKKLIDS